MKLKQTFIHNICQIILEKGETVTEASEKPIQKQKNEINFDSQRHHNKNKPSIDTTTDSHKIKMLLKNEKAQEAKGLLQNNKATIHLQPESYKSKRIKEMLSMRSFYDLLHSNDGFHALQTYFSKAHSLLIPHTSLPQTHTPHTPHTAHTTPPNTHPHPHLHSHSNLSTKHLTHLPPLSTNPDIGATTTSPTHFHFHHPQSPFITPNSPTYSNSHPNSNTNSHSNVNVNDNANENGNGNANLNANPRNNNKSYNQSPPALLLPPHQSSQSSNFTPSCASPNFHFGSAAQNEGVTVYLDEFQLYKVMCGVLERVNEVYVFDLFDALQPRGYATISFNEFYLLIILLAAKESGQLLNAFYNHSIQFFYLISAAQETISGERMLRFGRIISLKEEILQENCTKLGYNSFSQIKFDDFNLYYFCLFNQFDNSYQMFQKNKQDKRNIAIQNRDVSRHIGGARCCSGKVCRIL